MYYLVLCCEALALNAAAGSRFASAGSFPLPARSVIRQETANGLVVLMERVPASRLMQFSLLIKSGSATEGPLLGSGATHLLEHLIFKAEPEKNLASIVEKAGGYTNAHTSLDHTLFTVTVPFENWREPLDALLRAVFSPSFSEEDFAREREVVLREIARAEDRPEYQLSRCLWETAFLVHPYRLPVIGYPDLLQQLTCEEVRKYHASAYSPDNAILAIVGPADADEVFGAVRSSVSGVRRGFPWPASPLSEPRQTGFRERVKPFPTKLAYLSFACRIGSATSPDTPALDVLAWVLGGGRSSRLYRSLVEAGKAYQVSAEAYTPKEPGLFIIQAVCDPEKVGEVRRTILREVSRAKSGATDKELEQARNGLHSQLLFSLESVEERAGDLATSMHLTGNPLFSSDYLASVSQVDSKRVAEVARQYLTETGMTFCVVKEEGAATGAAGSEEGAGAARLERLANGIPVFLKRDRTLPIVSFSVLMKGGMLFEKKETNGLFPMMARLLIRGTERFSARDISDMVASWGGSISPYSGNNSMGLTLTVPARYWQQALSLLADIACNPSFPEKELQRERQEAIAEIVAREESAGGVAGRILREKIFAAHPYGLPDGGTKESVEAVTASLVRETYRLFFGAGNIVITASGDIDERRVMKELAEKFGSLSPARIPQVERFLPADHEPVVARQGIKKKEAVVLIGYPGITVDDRRRAVLEVFASLMNQQDGTLFDRLREKEALVYATHFTYFLGLQPGALIFSAQCRPDRVERVRQVIEEVIADVAARPISADALEKNKRKVLGHQRISRQTLSSQALEAGLSVLYGLGHDYAEQLEREVRAVTPQDVQSFAQEFFRPRRQVTVIVAPEDGTIHK